jgi:hypothetical protein
MKKNERGTVVVMAALLFPVLIFMVGLAVDFGIMYGVRNAAQNAADAAALVGAYTYAGMNPVTTDIVAAANRASLANPILGSTTVAPTSVVPYRCTDSLGIQNYCVQVTVDVTSPVFFARVFGKSPVPISVQATAQANTGFGFSNGCAKPIFVPDPDSLSPPVAEGGILHIRPTRPSGALVPSNYYSLDFTSIINPANPKPDPVVYSDGTSDAASGMPTYTDSWTKCVVTAIKCGQYINVQTGETGTPTNNAVQALIDSTGPGTVVVAPIWDSATAGPVLNGNGFQALIVGFIELSNLQVNAADVTAVRGRKLLCGAGNGAGSATGSYSTPVRLIQ